MPDITMCQNHDCPHAKSCYRHEATPSMRQSYSTFRPEPSGECIYHMPVWLKRKDDKQDKIDKRGGLRRRGGAVSNTITITVPIPHKALSPNARVHWRTLAGQKKKAKDSGVAHAANALMEEWIAPPMWMMATVNVQAFFKDRRSKWDRDNFIASLKAYVDGITSAGVLANDRGLHWGEVDLSGIDKANPRVELIFTKRTA